MDYEDGAQLQIEMNVQGETEPQTGADALDGTWEESGVKFIS